MLEEKDDRQTKNILGRLQVLEYKKFVRAKTILEIIEKSKRVTINRGNELIYEDKVPTSEKRKECRTSNGKIFQSTVGLWDKNQFLFTGIDAKSVLIIIDLNAIYPRSIYLINLAVNKDQYAVWVFIQNKMMTNQVWLVYLKQRKLKCLENYKDLLNGKLSEERNSAVKTRRRC